MDVRQTCFPFCVLGHDIALISQFNWNKDLFNKQVLKKDKLLYINNQTYFFKSLHFIMWKIGPFLHRLNW
jgi:hypothetical protein